jgi:hypothetical protein
MTAPLHANWGAETRRQWAAFNRGGLNLPNGTTIVVLAHGNGNEIGNSIHGTIDLDAHGFLAAISANMAPGAVPSAIYIYSCAPGIAQFTASVRIAAENDGVWANTRLLGRTNSPPAAGPVPPPTEMGWTEIFHGRGRR